MGKNVGLWGIRALPGSLLSDTEKGDGNSAYVACVDWHDVIADYFYRCCGCTCHCNSQILGK